MAHLDTNADHDRSDTRTSNNNIESNDEAETDHSTMTDPDSIHADADADTHSSDNVRSINTDVYINTLLACACHGMSTATPDNARIMISRHFTEEEIVQSDVMVNM